MLCQAAFKYLRERAETCDKNPFWYWGDFENFEIAGVNNSKLYYTYMEQDNTIPKFPESILQCRISSITESNAKMLLIYPRECLNKTPRSANTIVYY